MTTFKDLSFQEKDALLKYPAYISLLAANNVGKMDEKQKKAALKISHIKTYMCEPRLSEFYAEADKVFAASIGQLDNELPSKKDEREMAIKNEVAKIEKILSRFDEVYNSMMHRSMKSFTEHVSKAHDNVLKYLIFPISFNEIRH